MDATRVLVEERPLFKQFSIITLIVFQKPRVTLHPLQIEALIGVAYEDIDQKVASARRNVWRVFDVAREDEVVQLLSVRLLEREAATEQGVQNDTARPGVDFGACVAFPAIVDNFRRAIIGRTA